MISGVSLMTYPDSLGGTLLRMSDVLDTHFEGCFDSLHILPPYPSSGDRGFSPRTHLEIDPQFGSWDDILHLSHKYSVELDLIACHISIESEEFQDYLQNNHTSEYKSLFLHFSDIFNDSSMSEKELLAFCSLTPLVPFMKHTFADGENKILSKTFTTSQVDLNLKSETTWDLLHTYIEKLAQSGVSIIRLDAIQNSIKTPQYGSALQPQTYEVIERMNQLCSTYSIDIITEAMGDIEFLHTMNEKGIYTYDFQHIDCLLNMIQTGDIDTYVNWCNYKHKHLPHTINVLTNHDGFVVGDMQICLDDMQINAIRSRLQDMYPEITKLNKRTHNVNAQAINLTLFDALERDYDTWLMLHIIHIFSPGIPQLYYNDILCAQCDIENLIRTGEGRSLIRTNYTQHEIDTLISQNPYIKSLIEILRLHTDT